MDTESQPSTRSDSQGWDQRRAFLQRNSWIFLSAASICAFALTAAGTHELFQRAGQPIGLGDAAYYGLIAFVFNAPVSPGTPSPLALEIGRFLAPITLATAAIRALSTRLIVLGIGFEHAGCQDTRS